MSTQTMSAPRTALSFSRDLEFVQAPELAKRMGCQRGLWLRAVLKELIDNGLDAAEEAGIEAPVIRVTVEGATVSVSDNGPGMSPELVERLCVRSNRTSTREAYAAPDRGSQGNALPTIMALPFGYGLDRAGITITSRGVEHTIVLRVNRLAGRVDIERLTSAVPAAPGTTIALSWPDEIDIDELEQLVDEHAGLNPHAEFSFNDRDWPRRGAVVKWTAGEPVPPHWYTFERFEHRVLLEVHNNPEVTVSQFLETFRGLSGSAKRAAVAAELGLTGQRLSALLNDAGTGVNGERTLLLLRAMQLASRAPKHAVLGGAGKNSVAAWAAGNQDYAPGDLELFTYGVHDGQTGDGLPYRWEVGFARLPEEESEESESDDDEEAEAPERRERLLLVGQNFSPAIEPGEMAGQILNRASHYLRPWEPVAIFLHRISPARQTLDYGKSRVGISYQEAAEVAGLLDKLAAPWIKLRQKQDRTDKSPSKPPAPKEKRVTVKDAVAEVLPECYAFATSNGKYPTSPRQLYYQVRPKVLELTGRAALGYGYFSSNLLPRFLRTHAELTSDWRIHCKARGTLCEPHTDYRVPLGTSEVAGYCSEWQFATAGRTSFTMPEWEPDTKGPKNRFSAVVIVEKEGIAELLIRVGVGRKFDVAIIGNEGQSVEAELKLADRMDLPTFVLHDFDRSGLTICQNLRDGTWRHRYKNDFDVVEIGLRLDQVRGLESEPISKKNRQSVGDRRLRECGATEDEVKFLYSKRVELNALITEDLVRMVEDALTEHGIAKVVPDAGSLTAAWRSAKAHAEIEAAMEAANEAAEHWLEEAAPADLDERIREHLMRHPLGSWDSALRDIVSRGA